MRLREKKAQAILEYILLASIAIVLLTAMGRFFSTANSAFSSHFNTVQGCIMGG